jgi:ATP-dependent RNA helicase DHX37/DHR1
LQMKGMHIDQVVTFPFPTPPDRESLSQAEKVCFLGL